MNMYLINLILYFIAISKRWV